MTLKERQIEIWKEEISLRNKTHRLLFDILEDMSPEQRSKLEGTEISTYPYLEIVSINKDVVTTMDDSGGECILPLERLDQVQQKEIIDIILSYNK